MKKEKFDKEKINELMYFHGKTTDGYRFTIAGAINENKLHFGVSVCSDRDNFIKTRGRSIARTRLLSKRNYQNVGKYSMDIVDPIENKFNFFATQAAQHNFVCRKVLLKTCHLYRHKDELPF
jgi:hypothetical protein